MNEKDVVKDFLGLDTKPDIFQENKVEELIVEEKEIKEEALPFHKDPKVERYVQRQIEKALKEVKPSAQEQFRKETEDIKLPASFIKLVGNDTPDKVEVLKDLSDYFGKLKGEARQEFLEEVKKQEEQVKAQDAAVLGELTSGFEQIEEDYGIDLEADTKTRTAFVEFLRKVSPKNEDGEVKEFADIPSAWETFQEVNKKAIQPNRAKELAARGLARSSDAETPVSKPKSWNDFDRFLAKLSN